METSANPTDREGEELYTDADLRILDTSYSIGLVSQVANIGS
jgi:hypothetical protein